MTTQSFGRKLLEKAQELRFQPASRHYNFYLNIAGDDSFQYIAGCTDDEINHLIQVQGVSRLPLIYRQYLAYFGKASGDLFLGYDVNYKDLLSLKARALKVVEKTALSLPPDAFVFWGEQDYAYCYFLTQNELDDPPVYFLSESMAYDPVSDDEFSYRDAQGVGWERLSAYLAIFIREREGEEAYLEFLKNNT